jgi:ring-1,2-phenylacetyl-CoA epoxidase subunit PaaD
VVTDPATDASTPSTPTESAPLDLPAAIAAIADPEVPVLTIEDLGILRKVQVDEHARTVTVLITPTYSGCPAMGAIRAHIEHVARRLGYTARVKTRLSPAWTTDWMSAAGRHKLREFGIAPPGQRSEIAGQPVSLSLRSLMIRRVTCPLCGSDDTQEISRFGSTACKALRRCNACREPFDEFKTIR